jgi:hypothetical protein
MKKANQLEISVRIDHVAYGLVISVALGGTTWSSLSDEEEDSFGNLSYSSRTSTIMSDESGDEGALSSFDAFEESERIQPVSQFNSSDESSDDESVEDPYLEQLQAVLSSQQHLLTGVYRSEEGRGILSDLVALATRSGYDPSLTAPLYDPFSLLGDVFRDFPSEERALPLIRTLNAHVLPHCSHYAQLCLVFDAVKDSLYHLKNNTDPLKSLDERFTKLQDPGAHFLGINPLHRFLQAHYNPDGTPYQDGDQEDEPVHAFKSWAAFSLLHHMPAFWHFFPRMMQQQYGYRHLFLHKDAAPLMNQVISLCLKTGYNPRKQEEQQDPLYAMGYAFGCTTQSVEGRDLLVSFVEKQALPAFRHHVGVLMDDDRLSLSAFASLLAHLTPPCDSALSTQKSPMDYMWWRLEALTRYERPPISCTLYNPLVFLEWVNAYEQTHPLHFAMAQESLANHYLGFSFLLSHDKGARLLEAVITQHAIVPFGNADCNTLEKLGNLFSFCDTPEQRDACLTLIEEEILPLDKDIPRIYRALDTLEDCLVALMPGHVSDISASAQTRAASPSDQEITDVSFLTLLRGMTELRLSAHDLVLTPTLDAFCRTPADRLACLQGLRSVDDPDHVQTLLTPVPLIFCRTPEDLSHLIAAFGKIASPEIQSEIHAFIRTLPLKEGITTEIVTKLMDRLVAMEAEKRQAAMTLLLDVIVPHSKVPSLYPDYLSWFEKFLPENAKDLKAYLTPSNVEGISSPSDLTYFLSALAFKG